MVRLTLASLFAACLTGLVGVTTQPAGGQEAAGSETESRPVGQPPASVSNEPAETPPSADEGTESAEAPGSAPGEEASKILLPIAPATNQSKSVDGKLQFAFEGARWREVIKWLADEAGLALHVDDIPTGSFTYSDPSLFSHQEAIDRVNLFLLPQSFTLVRSGQLLSVINLSDPRGLAQLDALAKMVPPNKLADQPAHEIVKCIFPLGKLKAEDAVTELQPLNLLTSPSVFTRTNQIMVIDTVAKLQNVKAILDSFEPDKLDNGTVVETFILDHVHAEDILSVARPHLGLATGETIGIDVSVSSDVQGKFIFVTGVEDKVSLLRGLVESIDKPGKLSVTDGEGILKRYPVASGNAEVIYNVLLTLMSGKPVRLSVDPLGGSIVALASPEDHKQIEATVTQFQTAEEEFAVIPLKHVNAYFAITLLEQMLELEDTTTSSFSDDDDRRDRDRDYRDRDRRSRSAAPLVVPEKPPKIDADPGNRRLYVRGLKSQIEQIQRIIEEIDVPEGAAAGAGVLGEGSDLRILPLKGRQAEELLTMAARFWQGDNPVYLLGSIVARQRPSERVINGESTAASRPQATRQPQRAIPDVRLLTESGNRDAAPIRCQVTVRGLIMQSDDVASLDKFISYLMALAGPLQKASSPPTVFYLKHTKPDDALRMLAELLDGGETASETDAGSLVNGYVSSTTSLLGSFITTREGVMTLMADTMTVVSDARLNRLIAQGTDSDIELIEGYLKIIDKDSSITSVETYGTSHLIELQHVSAAEAAEVLRQAFVGRVAASTSGRSGQPGQQRGGQPSNQGVTRGDDNRNNGDDRNNGDNGDNGRGNAKQQQPRSSQAAPVIREPQMTIAVHETSNSLIVTAPDGLFRQVQQLVELIDVRSQQSLQVVPTNNAGLLEMLLQEALEEDASGRTSNSTSRGTVPRPSGSPNSRPTNSPPASKPDLNALRARFGR